MWESTPTAGQTATQRFAIVIDAAIARHAPGPTIDKVDLADTLFVDAMFIGFARVTAHATVLPINTEIATFAIAIGQTGHTNAISVNTDQILT
jgi:hypothetical protein